MSSFFRTGHVFDLTLCKELVVGKAASRDLRERDDESCSIVSLTVVESEALFI